jgi:hypothetical protein
LATLAEDSGIIELYRRRPTTNIKELLSVRTALLGNRDRRPAVSELRSDRQAIRVLGGALLPWRGMKGRDHAGLAAGLGGACRRKAGWQVFRATYALPDEGGSLDLAIEAERRKALRAARANRLFRLP